jgi:hypothetical protein
MWDGKFNSPEQCGDVAKPVFCNVGVLLGQCVSGGQENGESPPLFLKIIARRFAFAIGMIMSCFALTMRIGLASWTRRFCLATAASPCSLNAYLAIRFNHGAWIRIS